MTLRELIEMLQALTPSSALEAQVTVTDGTTDVGIQSVSYTAGEVMLHVDPLPEDKYDEGYEAGYEAGKEDQDDDEG